MARVKEYMQKDFAMVSEKTPLYEVFKRMHDERIPFFVVVADGGNRVVGILSKTDIIKERKTGTLNEDGGIVRDLLSGIIVAVNPNDFMEDATKKMEQIGGIRQLVVVDTLEPVGVLTQDDIINWEWDEQHKGKK